MAVDTSSAAAAATPVVGAAAAFAALSAERMASNSVAAATTIFESATKKDMLNPSADLSRSGYITMNSSDFQLTMLRICPRNIHLQTRIRSILAVNIAALAGDLLVHGELLHAN